jgi:DNA-binding Lrp family transcriptional regulator
MNRVLKLLLDGEKLSPAQMSEVLGLPQAEIDSELRELEEKGILLGWRPVISPNADIENLVRAVIEVKITPERGGGFNRHAERISRFDEVESCYLMSGSYDLLVIARGQTLHQVAAFVSERLSTIEGVLSTATHFLLRSYKEQGYLLERTGDEKTRPDITP